MFLSYYHYILSLLLTSKNWQDQIRALLNVTSELPDNELLLQKHFVAIISSVWRANCRVDARQSMACSKVGFYPNKNFSDSSLKKFPRLTEKMSLTNLRECSKLVSRALVDVHNSHEDPMIVTNKLNSNSGFEHMDLILSFPRNSVDSESAFPLAVSVSIHSPVLLEEANEPPCQSLLAEPSCMIAESRFR